MRVTSPITADQYRTLEDNAGTRTNHSLVLLELVPRQSDANTVLRSDFIQRVADSERALTVESRPRHFISFEILTGGEGVALSLSASMTADGFDYQTRTILSACGWNFRDNRGSPLALFKQVSIDSSTGGDFYERTNMSMMALLSEAQRTAATAIPNHMMPRINLYVTIIAGSGRSRVEISKLVLRQWADLEVTVDFDTFG